MWPSKCAKGGGIFVFVRIRHNTCCNARGEGRGWGGGGAVSRWLFFLLSLSHLFYFVLYTTIPTWGCTKKNPPEGRNPKRKEKKERKKNIYIYI